MVEKEGERECLEKARREQGEKAREEEERGESETASGERAAGNGRLPTVEAAKNC